MSVSRAKCLITIFCSMYRSVNESLKNVFLWHLTTGITYWIIYLLCPRLVKDDVFSSFQSSFPSSEKALGLPCAWACARARVFMSGFLHVKSRRIWPIFAILGIALCHWRTSYCCALQFPTFNDNSIADPRTFQAAVLLVPLLAYGFLKWSMEWLIALRRI